MATNKRLRTKTYIVPSIESLEFDGATRSAASKQPAASESSVDQKLKLLTDNYKFSNHFKVPDDAKRSIEALKMDLSEVPVLSADGAVTDVYRKIEAESLLSREDKDLIWKCMAVVRDAFLQLEMPGQKPGRKVTRDTFFATGGYQWNMNWKHTRAEIDQVLEAAKLLNLEGIELRDALIASIFSDAVKNRQNFIIHNIHGAQGAAAALAQLMDLTDPESIRSIERISFAVKAHQITPPEFMARASTILIKKKLQSLGEHIEAESPKAKILDSIYQKICDPINEKHLVGDLTRIDFSAAEKRLLALIDVEDWFVPHPRNPDSRIADAVIAGDHSINYNHPEGFAKIALIRGPDTEAFFEDATIHHSLDSAVNSFSDSFRMIRTEVQPLAVSGLRRCKTAVERVTSIMRELFNRIAVGGETSEDETGLSKVKAAIERAHEKQPELFTVGQNQLSSAGREYTKRAVETVALILQEWIDNYGAIPYNPKDRHSITPGGMQLPFWNAPLKYPPRDDNGQPKLDELSNLERRQLAFAEKIREIAVELLRAEQWIY